MQTLFIFPLHLFQMETTMGTTKEMHQMLRERILKFGTKQTAEALGLRVSTVSRHVIGNRKPDAQMLAAYARLFDLDLSELVDFYYKPIPTTGEIPCHAAGHLSPRPPAPIPDGECKVPSLESRDKRGE